MIEVILKMIEVSLQKSVRNRLTDFENKLMAFWREGGREKEKKERDS